MFFIPILLFHRQLNTETQIELRTRPTLHLPAELRREVEGWAQNAYPFESCGLLIGRGEGGSTEVTDVTRARNLDMERAHDRYLLDPVDQLAAEELARMAGLSVVGVWHSHPDHPARPSETDRAGAYEGYSYVIVSVTSGRVEDVRSFRLAGDPFIEEAILIQEEPES